MQEDFAEEIAFQVGTLYTGSYEEGGCIWVRSPSHCEIWEIQRPHAVGSVRLGWNLQKQEHREELVESRMLVAVRGLWQPQWVFQSLYLKTVATVSLYWGLFVFSKLLLFQTWWGGKKRERRERARRRHIWNFLSALKYRWSRRGFS